MKKQIVPFMAIVFVVGLVIGTTLVSGGPSVSNIIRGHWSRNTVYDYITPRVESDNVSVDTYLNFNLTNGSDGVGLRWSGGMLQSKNDTGGWVNLGTGGGGGFSGSWNDLIDVPEGFADNVDNDTVHPFNQELNITDDVEFNTVTALSFKGDGSMLTNLEWGDLIDVPAGFSDGIDNDTVDTNWDNLTNVPVGFADGVDNGDDLSDNTTDDLPEGVTNFYCDLARIQSECSDDFHNIGGTDDDVPDSGDLGIIDSEAEFEAELFEILTPGEGGSGGNPFDQNLNTSDNPTFSGLNITNKLNFSDGEYITDGGDDVEINADDDIDLFCAYEHDVNVNGNMVPTGNDAFDLGSVALGWDRVFCNNISFYDGLFINSLIGGSNLNMTFNVDYKEVLHLHKDGDVTFSDTVIADNFTSIDDVVVGDDLFTSHIEGDFMKFYTDDTFTFCPNQDVNTEILSISNVNNGDIQLYAFHPMNTVDLILKATGSVIINDTDYMNFGDTGGSGGYGFRNNSGIMEYKDANNDWNPFATEFSYDNYFDQDLNTTDDVVFNNLTSAYTTFINNTEITNGTFKIKRDMGNLGSPVFRIDAKLGGGVIQGMLFDLDSTSQAVAGLVMDGYLRDIIVGNNNLWGLRYDISDKTPYQNTGTKNYYGVQVDHDSALGTAGNMRYINFYSLMGGCQHLGGSQNIEAYGFRNAFDSWANYDFGSGQSSDIIAYGFYGSSPSLTEIGLGVTGTKQFYGLYLEDMNNSVHIDKGVAIQTNGGEHLLGDDVTVTSGDLDVQSGQIYGNDFYFGGGEGGSKTADAYLKGFNGQLYKANLGMMALHNGSIIGASVTYNVGTVTTGGTCEFEVHSNGNPILNISVYIGSTGNKKNLTIQSRGDGKFVQGDVLTCYYDEGAGTNVAIDDIQMWVEGIYND